MLNIKNPETYRLARLLADQTGESLTAAVTVALQERLQRLTGPHRVTDDELLALGRDCARELSGPPKPVDAYLYDRDGLPR
jgi:antitoxin VapB